MLEKLIVITWSLQFIIQDFCFLNETLSRVVNNDWVGKTLNLPWNLILFSSFKVELKRVFLLRETKIEKCISKEKQNFKKRIRWVLRLNFKYDIQLRVYKSFIDLLKLIIFNKKYFYFFRDSQFQLPSAPLSEEFN